MTIKNAFCASCQEMKDHIATFFNNEYILTCTCGRFFKISGDLTKEERDKAIEDHEKQNRGQLTQEEVDRIIEEKLADL